MVYFGAALVVFKVTQLVRLWIEGPAWAVWLFTVALSAACLWIAGAEPAWCIAVAAGSGLLHRIETLLMASSDACKVAVLRNSRRR